MNRFSLETKTLINYMPINNKYLMWLLLTVYILDKKIKTL